jgi:hypothetical protein
MKEPEKTYEEMNLFAERLRQLSQAMGKMRGVDPWGGHSWHSPPRPLDPLEEWRGWCRIVVGPKAAREDEYYFDATLLPLMRKPHPNPAKQVVPSTQKLKSQKAAGVVALQRRTVTIDRMETNTWRDKLRVWPYQWPGRYPVFARPCPTRPRHGFVDSRIIKNKEELFAMIEECQEAGEGEPEILFMPFIDSQWSGILTPAGLAIGPGHAGATEGQGSVAIPAPVERQVFRQFIRGERHLLGIDWNEKDPYIEFLYPTEKHAPQVVQIREGEQIDLRDRFVPKRMKVKRVVRAEGDLVEWEKTATSFVGEQGVVVWHPGGTMASHYAVHCKFNDIPIFLTEEEPKVGEWIKPSLGAPQLTEQQIARAVSLIPRYYRDFNERGKNMAVDGQSANLANLSAASAHSVAEWGGDEHLLRIMAKSIAAAFMLGGMACVGEARHYKQHLGGTVPKMTPDAISNHHKSRHEVYQGLIGMKPGGMANAVKATLHDFAVPGWSDSYGGPNWAKCAMAVLNLGEAVSTTIDDPTPKNWSRVIDAWNKVINISHNGGALLNKFGLDGATCSAAPGMAMSGKALREVIDCIKQAPKYGYKWDVSKHVYPKEAYSTIAGMVRGDREGIRSRYLRFISITGISDPKEVKEKINRSHFVPCGDCGEMSECDTCGSCPDCNPEDSDDCPTCDVVVAE